MSDFYNTGDMVMQVEQSQWSYKTGWQPEVTNCSAQLVLIFGNTDQLTDERFEEIRNKYNDAILFGCSTAGEIQDISVYDETITLTAINFKDTEIKLASIDITDFNDCYGAGRGMAELFPEEGLSHVLVLSDGLNVNGTELVKGIKSFLPEQVEVTGGLAGDDSRFQSTLVIANDKPTENKIAAVGFYGDRLTVGFGSLGGWDPFGPDRLITRSDGNVLYELDGKSALSLYKSYLGEHATGLPSTGLLFPLALSTPGRNEVGLVRTILAIDEEKQSMTFAGDVPEGSYVRLMKANFDRLVDGAVGAAEEANKTMLKEHAELGILISCVGRKLVLQQRVEEEVEAVRDVLGKDTPLTGFYSYGEISPYLATGHCELHNQTMTITTFSER